MAQEKSAGAQYVIESVDRQWIHQSLVNQRHVLVRSRAKERVGSEIHVLRGKEIDALTVLIERFA